MTMEDFNKKKNDLEEQKADAEASFDGVEVGRLEQALADLEKSKASFEDKAEHAGEATENQVKQVVGLDGSQEALDEKTAPVDEKIEGVKEEVEGEVENQVKEFSEMSTSEKIEAGLHWTELEKKSAEELKEIMDQHPFEYEKDSSHENVNLWVDIIRTGKLNAEELSAISQRANQGNNSYDAINKAIKNLEI